MVIRLQSIPPTCVLVGIAVPFGTVLAAERWMNCPNLAQEINLAWHAMVILLMIGMIAAGLPRAALGLVRPANNGLIHVMVAVDVCLVGWIVAAFFRPVCQGGTVPSSASPLPVVGLMTSIIVAPVSEELLFRNILFAGLGRHLPVVAAALGSSLIFWLAHTPAGYRIDAFFIGVALCYLRAATGSTVPCIIVHGLINVLWGVRHIVERGGAP